MASSHAGEGAIYSFRSCATTNFCIAGPNSVSAGGALSQAAGSTSITANDLLLSCAPIPNGQPGIFYYGQARVQLPFGNGYRCIGPGSHRLPVEIATGGVLNHALDNTQPPAATGQLTAGSTWLFQAWYRDPAAGGSGFNLSDGIALRFVP